jgi:glycosyltransferase involved in cell wall biosynthesis
MQKKPKISIILPTHNGGDHIILSIKSIQEQSFSDWELIVVIDGSTDATLELVSKVALSDNRIFIIHNLENKGIQRSLNEGLRRSRGKYIARIDDDDVWFDVYKLKKQYDFLEKNSDHVLVGTGVVLVNEKGFEITRYLLPENNDQIRKKILSQNCFAHPSVLFRKSVIDMAGKYSEDLQYRHVEDYELWLRMGRLGKFANLPRHMIFYRVSAGSISGKNKLNQFKKTIFLSWRYKKDYENFIINFIHVLTKYFIYLVLGWVLNRFGSLRMKTVIIYRKFF